MWWLSNRTDATKHTDIIFLQTLLIFIRHLSQPFRSGIHCPCTTDQNRLIPNRADQDLKRELWRSVDPCLEPWWPSHCGPSQCDGAGSVGIGPHEWSHEGVSWPKSLPSKRSGHPISATWSVPWSNQSWWLPSQSWWLPWWLSWWLPSQRGNSKCSPPISGLNQSNISLPLLWTISIAVSYASVAMSVPSLNLLYHSSRSLCRSSRSFWRSFKQSC